MKDNVIYQIDRARNAGEVAISFLVAIALVGLALLTYFGNPYDYQASDVRYLILIPLSILWFLYWIEAYRSRAELFLLLLISVLYEYIWIRSASSDGSYNWLELVVFAAGFWTAGIYNLVFEERRQKTRSADQSQPRSQPQIIMPVIPASDTAVAQVTPPVLVMPPAQDSPDQGVRDLINHAVDPNSPNQKRALSALMNMLLSPSISRAKVESELIAAGLRDYKRILDGIFGSHSNLYVQELLADDGGKYIPVLESLLSSVPPTSVATPPPVQVPDLADDPPTNPASSAIVDIDKLLAVAGDWSREGGEEAARALAKMLESLDPSAVQKALADAGVSTNIAEGVAVHHDARAVRDLLTDWAAKEKDRRVQQKLRDSQRKWREVLRTLLAAAQAPAQVQSIRDTKPRIPVTPDDPFSFLVQVGQDESEVCAKELYAVLQRFGLDKVKPMLTNLGWGFDGSFVDSALSDPSSLRAATRDSSFVFQIVFALSQIKASES